MHGYAGERMAMHGRTGERYLVTPTTEHENTTRPPPGHPRKGT